MNKRVMRTNAVFISYAPVVKWTLEEPQNTDSAICAQHPSTGTRALPSKEPGPSLRKGALGDAK
jgi:hypothetical protein